MFFFEGICENFKNYLVVSKKNDTTNTFLSRLYLDESSDHHEVKFLEPFGGDSKAGDGGFQKFRSLQKFWQACNLSQRRRLHEECK